MQLHTFRGKSAKSKLTKLPLFQTLFSILFDIFWIITYMIDSSTFELIREGSLDYKIIFIPKYLLTRSLTIWLKNFWGLISLGCTN